MKRSFIPFSIILIVLFNLTDLNAARVYENKMEELGHKHNTLKITYWGYHRFFHPFLKEYCSKPVNMLEIGVDGKNSIHMWMDYLPRGTICGIDINVNEEQAHRMRLFKGDQSDLAFLNHVVNSIKGPIDIINDDGSHVPEHQLKSFIFLFDKLKDGGVYIIEDIETSYWPVGTVVYGYPLSHGYLNSKSTVEIFKKLIDVVNDLYLSPKNKKKRNNTLMSLGVPLHVVKKIGMITFARNCIIIKKRDDSYNPYEHDDYVFRYW